MDATAALEWNRFLHMAETEARTEPGKASLRAFEKAENWAKDITSARLLQQETQEINALLDRDALWGPMLDLKDPSQALEVLGHGAVLEIADLLAIRSWLYASDSWSQMPRDEIRGERIKRAIASLPDPTDPLRILDHVLTPEGELSEKASPKLASINFEIRALQREIHTVLDNLLKTFAQKGVLQEKFTDVRDGRYVLPIKISCQNEVEGIIYEASASHQTVFVEPREVAALNNRLRQRHNDLIQEIFQVLQDTSKKLQPFAQEIQAAVAILTHWDAVQARARLGLRYGGKAISIVEERSFRLRQTAHPLLWWSLSPDAIVRNEIDFEDPVRVLLLSGPNTGGKTVLLKTLGIAGLCARTGFPFPGIGTPVVPFFDSFFVDVGDPQSIEEHLSSFSGHILRFKDILTHVTGNSLVLLDELNTATDPEEGAALGRAFLEILISRGAMVVTTTHDPHLKALAISDKRIQNASMAFDETTRTPSYQMSVGTPGRSRALETAQRLGLPEEVLQLARSYLTEEHIEFERLLARLESDSQETIRARKEAVQIKEEAERLKKEWTERTQASVNEMLERTRVRLRRILEQSQDEVRSLVRKLDERKSRRDLDQTRARLNEAFSTAAGHVETALSEEAPEIAKNITIKAPEETQLAEKPQIKAGSAVRIPKWKNTGTVLEIHGNKAKVAMGALQMTLPLSDLDAMTEAETARASGTSGQTAARRAVGSLERPEAPAPTLDIRGMRLDDAMSQLERYLDQAYRSDALQEVTIVHGLGTGALRENTRKLLKSLPYVKTYRDGGLGHGGTGATIVEFDRN